MNFFDLNVLLEQFEEQHQVSLMAVWKNLGPGLPGQNRFSVPRLFFAL